MGEQLTVLGESQGEYSEKHSKFIANLCHIETEQEAINYINEIRSKYWDAKHHVFAYIVEGGRLVRFSDDKEPHGTAGKPVLDIISGAGLSDVIIVVTRYFGGVLLGTGGLVRAYSKAAKQALESANKVRMVPGALLFANCGYSDHKKLCSVIEEANGTIEKTDFTDSVSVEFCLKESDKEAFLLKLSESFSGNITAKELEKRIFPEKI